MNDAFISWTIVFHVYMGYVICTDIALELYFKDCLLSNTVFLNKNITALEIVHHVVRWNVFSKVLDLRFIILDALVLS